MSDYIKREDAKDAVINVVGWESIARYVDELSKHFSTKDNEYYDALMDAEDAIDDGRGGRCMRAAREEMAKMNKTACRRSSCSGNI